MRLGRCPSDLMAATLELLAPEWEVYAGGDLRGHFYGHDRTRGLCHVTTSCGSTERAARRIPGDIVYGARKMEAR